ncbi:hypothetical protein P7K49_039906, partial [Saguinus oedipus]
AEGPQELRGAGPCGVRDDAAVLPRLREWADCGGGTALPLLRLQYMPLCAQITGKVTNRKYPKLKEVDDVLSGAAAWENVDSTA